MTVNKPVTKPPPQPPQQQRRSSRGVRRPSGGADPPSQVAATSASTSERKSKATVTSRSSERHLKRGKGGDARRAGGGGASQASAGSGASVDGQLDHDLTDEEKTGEYRELTARVCQLQRTDTVVRQHQDVIDSLDCEARHRLVWSQYMKCDGLPDPTCVRQLNTYLSLWRADEEEFAATSRAADPGECGAPFDGVLRRTRQVLPMMSTLESMIECPDDWALPDDAASSERRRVSSLDVSSERRSIFAQMKQLQLDQLNRFTYTLLLDVAPMVDAENNVINHFLSSDLISMGLWGNVGPQSKHSAARGAQFDQLGFSFDMPDDLIGGGGGSGGGGGGAGEAKKFAVRVMHVQYDHYSKMCRSYKIPPRAAKDKSTHIDVVRGRISEIEAEVRRRRAARHRLLAEYAAAQVEIDELEVERVKVQAAEKKAKKKAGVTANGAESQNNRTSGGAGHLSEAEQHIVDKVRQLQRHQVMLMKQEKDLMSTGKLPPPKSTKADSNSNDGSSGDSQADGSSSAIAAGGGSGGGQARETVQERYDLYKLKTIGQDELNLRRNIILGGVFYFNMHYVPPQPVRVGHWTICQLETPQHLQTVPWTAEYKTPVAAAADAATVTKKTPEEIEREIKLQEMELQKLVQVSIKLPTTSLWFEPPTVVRWLEVADDPDASCWSAQDFYDIKFDDGKQTLTFRTKRLGIFALSAFRFSNLPLQSWEMIPLAANRCSLALSAAAVQVEFEIGLDNVTLTKFAASGNKPPLRDLLDRPMLIRDLVRGMRRQGVDIFPDYDSHCYIEGLPLKDIQTEEHLYRCMSLTANSLNFAWSRWNLLSGFDKLILQYRVRVPIEAQPAAPPPTLPELELLFVTPHGTSVLQCGEASQTFDEANRVAGFDGLADVYTMAEDRLGPKVANQMATADPVFVHTVFQFLCQTKILSYA